MMLTVKIFYVSGEESILPAFEVSAPPEGRECVVHTITGPRVVELNDALRAVYVENAAGQTVHTYRGATGD